MRVVLDPAEVRTAYAAADERQHETKARRASARYGATCDPTIRLHNDLIGTVGECAVAKALGIPWDAGHWGAPDVGRFQVRATSAPDGGMLMHPEDGDDEAYIFALIQRRRKGHGPFDPVTVDVHGWLLGVECKQDRWWRYDWRRPCFRVPREALRPLDTIELDR